MKYGVHFQVDARLLGHMQLVDALERFAAMAYTERSTKFTFGNFISLYYITDQEGAKIAKLLALILSSPAAYIGPI